MTALDGASPETSIGAFLLSPEIESTMNKSSRLNRQGCGDPRTERLVSLTALAFLPNLQDKMPDLPRIGSANLLIGPSMYRICVANSNSICRYGVRVSTISGDPTHTTSTLMFLPYDRRSDNATTPWYSFDRGCQHAIRL